MKLAKSNREAYVLRLLCAFLMEDLMEGQKSNLQQIDYTLLFLLFLLMCISLLAIYSGSGQYFSDNPTYYVKRQVIWFIVGIVLMISAMIIDYDLFKEPWSRDIGYFHAFWNREHITKISQEVPPNKKNQQNWEGKNLSGKDNYTILDTKADGQLAGLLLCVDNIAGGWYGEGDDMIFIDDDNWPPSLHGTGTEEIFGGGACPQYETPTHLEVWAQLAWFDFSGKCGIL